MMKDMTSLAKFDEQYQARGAMAQRLYPNEALLCFLGRYFGRQDKDEIKVLEVGCGSGANLWMIAKEGFDAYGMDGSEAGVSIARKQMEEKWQVKATLKQGLFDAIPFDDNMFDIVVDVVSMQHIDLAMTYSALREIKRVLKSNGEFFSYRLSDHSVMYENSDSRYIDACTVECIENPDMPLAGNRTVSFWSPSKVREEYARAGLKIEEIERRSRTYRNGEQIVEYLSIVACK